jgi:uncharacterized protein YjiS (DUF1127 family)
MNRMSKSIAAESAAWQSLAILSVPFRKVFAALGHRYVDYIDLIRQRRALAQLDSRLLDDIGVSREDAVREAAKPFWR